MPYRDVFYNSREINSCIMCLFFVLLYSQRTKVKHMNTKKKSGTAATVRVRISSENLPEILSEMHRSLLIVSRSKTESQKFLFDAGIVTPKGQLKRVYK